MPEKVIVLPLDRRPILPGAMVNMAVRYTPTVRSILPGPSVPGPYVGLFFRKEGKEGGAPQGDVTDLSQIHEIGVLATVLACNLYYRNPDPSHAHIVKINPGAVRRVRIKERVPNEEFFTVKIEPLDDLPYDPNDKEIGAIVGSLREKLTELQDILHSRIIQDGQQGNSVFKWEFSYLTELLDTADPHRPGEFADLSVTLATRFTKGSQIQEILETLDVKKRVEKCVELLSHEASMLRLSQTHQEAIEERFRDHIKKSMLKEKLKEIKRELGLESDSKTLLITKFEERLKSLHPSPDAAKVIEEEMNKLNFLEASSLEFNTSRSYLEWLTQLPWGVFSKENLDVNNAAKILDEDHYGLKDVKSRILEFIAVGKLKGTVQGKIILLVGPPGVGKTSVGKSIARSLDREFFRFCVGGMSDVSEIKGHRRTYVGAMPGKILQALKQVKTSNPVILIDEIDKLSRGYQGDPASALLEVLDPEQNGKFLDHYLDVPYDLSRVLFVCTANTTDTIPPPLLDRMEVITLSGYLADEKVSIASQYLVPRAMSESGLSKKNLDVSGEVIRELITNYCREAGVRSLVKLVEKIMRKAAFNLASNKTTKKQKVTMKNMKDFVGNPLFDNEKMYAQHPPGVVMGLAWTALGGSTLYIETCTEPYAQDRFRMTGQLGDVMKESVEIAYTFAKRYLEEVNVGNRFFEKASLHVHIPAGATKKDGPSAGVTIVTSLLSLALGKAIPSDVSMTGEISLTGKVLVIGGVKEKAIAATRSQVKTIILPEGNRKDWLELPENIQEPLTPVFVSEYKQIYDFLFRGKNSGNKGPVKAAQATPTRKGKGKGKPEGEKEEVVEVVEEESAVEVGREAVVEEDTSA